MSVVRMPVLYSIVMMCICISSCTSLKYVKKSDKFPEIQMARIIPSNTRVYLTTEDKSHSFKIKNVTDSSLFGRRFLSKKEHILIKNVTKINNDLLVTGDDLSVGQEVTITSIDNNILRNVSISELRNDRLVIQNRRSVESINYEEIKELSFKYKRDPTFREFSRSLLALSTFFILPVLAIFPLVAFTLVILILFFPGSGW